MSKTTQEILAQVRRIEIKTRRLSDHMFSGEYHSSFKGRGMTFAEVRPYQYGDDIRNIDWNVTARYNQPFVKMFEEERELTMLLLVDISGSEYFGTRKQFKRDTLTEIAATLAFSAIQNNDKVGVILFSDIIELFIPPKKGRFHVLRIIREILEFEPRGTGTNIRAALEFMSGIMKKKAIVFVLSDFDDDGYEKALKLTGRRHDMTGIRVYDRRDIEVPALGYLPVLHPETGKRRWINTSSKAWRKAYRQHFLEREDYFKNAFMRSGAGSINMPAHHDYVKYLLTYFKSKA